MPQVNLSDISGPELRQLLDSSRRRGDAALSYKILQEMAARREAPARRRPAEPRLVAVELGEPAEADDLPPMPNWRPPPREPEDAAPAPAALPEATAPAQPEPGPQSRSRRKAPPAPPEESAEAEAVAAGAPPAPKADRPLTLQAAEPPPSSAEAADRADAELRLPAAPPRRGGPPRPPRFRLVAGLALGIPIGILLGWGSVWFARDALWPPAAPAAAPVQAAALAPLPAPADPVAAAAEPEVEAAPEAAAPPEADLPAAPASPVEAPASAAEPEGAAVEPAPRTAEATETARPAKVRSGSAAAGGCAAAPTPADRAICGDPELLRLQAELRRAYSAALEAHEDRALLRERQLAWRDARSEVSDPERLARLYEARIRKLNAATAEARRAR